MKAVKKQDNVEYFCKKYGVKILVGIGGVALIILGSLGIKRYLDDTKFERYLKSASLPELKAIRDVAHKEFLNTSNDIECRGKIGDIILPTIDKQISKREWGNKIPAAPSYHREHGFNLYKPD